MAFTNRWVCAVDSSIVIDPDEILGKNKVLDTVKGKEYQLYKVIVFDPPMVSESGNIEYVGGKLYYQMEFPIIDYEIEQIGNNDIQIRESSKIIRRTFTVDFWMSLYLDQNYILFKNSRIEGDGLAELSYMLFESEDGIKPVTFLVEKLEKDLRNGVIDAGMWGLSFKGRVGSVHSGTMYGEEIDIDDELYSEVSNTKKGFLGLKIDMGNEILKVRVTKKGTITLYRKYDSDMEANQRVLEVIENYLEDYITF